MGPCGVLTYGANEVNLTVIKYPGVVGVVVVGYRVDVTSAGGEGGEGYRVGPK